MTTTRARRPETPKDRAIVLGATTYRTLVDDLTSTEGVTLTSGGEGCGCSDPGPAPAEAADQHAVTDTAPEQVVSTALDLDPTTPSTETLAEGDEQPQPQTRVRWAGVLGMEGELTGDGRLIEHGALRWEVSAETPAPIRYVASDVGAHDGAVVVGVIDSIERRDGGVIWGEGWLDGGSEVGREAVRVVGENLSNGVSMDLDDVSFEIRIAAELVDQMLAAPEDAEGDVETDEDGRIVVAELNSDDEVRVTTSGRIRAATIVAIPAFADARITLTGDVEEVAASEDDQDAATLALVASIAPAAAPAAWFDDPGLSGPTPLTITEDGRVYGHIALWGTCHVSHSSNGRCVTPPRSQSGYAGFHLGAYMTAEGREIAVGHLTVGTGHADERLNSASTVAHYDNTGTQVAHVRAYEDSFGIAVAGALDADATEGQVRRLRSAPISGDWRRQGTGLELVAALAVNVPGFPVPRPSGLVAGGHVTSLVAAGMLAPTRVPAPTSPNALSTEDLRYLKRLAQREREHEEAERRASVDAMAAVLARARVDAMAAALSPATVDA